MGKLVWSRKSSKLLEALDERLVRVLERALSYGIMDMTVIEAVRSRELQDEYFNTGRSRVRWPHSKHNVTAAFPRARAVDVAPYILGKGLSWNSYHCAVLAGIILAAAAAEGVPVRWGGNWDEDLEPITDQNFQDLVHFEVSE